MPKQLKVKKAKIMRAEPVANLDTNPAEINANPDADPTNLDTNPTEIDADPDADLASIKQPSPLAIATAIVARATGRLPVQYYKHERITPEIIQEHDDAAQMAAWAKLPYSEDFAEAFQCLDDHFGDWRGVRKNPAEVAGIVERANVRVAASSHAVPKYIIKSRRITPESVQENQDAQKLGDLKKSIKSTIPPRLVGIVAYLDANLADWRATRDPMDCARAIVGRALQRQAELGYLIPRYLRVRTTAEQIQETQDAQKLGDWKRSLKLKTSQVCTSDMLRYLDDNLGRWRNISEDLAETPI